MKGYHPLSHPLAEQKMIRGSISDIVDEKNQKIWKLLPEGHWFSVIGTAKFRGFIGKLG